MSKYAVNEEGLQALKSMSVKLVEAVGEIYNLVDSLENQSEEFNDTLGPHKYSLISAITNIKKAQHDSVQYVLGLSGSLNDIAEAYQDIIDNDNLKTGNNSQAIQNDGMNSTGGNTSNISDSNLNSVNPINTVKESGKNWSSELSIDEVNAITDYTGNNYYKNINGVLRGSQSKYDSGNKERAINIHSALSKSQIPCDCIVYRGAPLASLGEYKNFSNEELVGHTIVEPGFMSTSIEKGNEFGGEIKLEIEVPKGTNGAYVGYLSQAGHYETEVLFDAGQIMEITGARNDMFGNRIISVKIVK